MSSRPLRHQLQPNSYLPHLDGIRALALAGVLLFHFNVPNFTGGFLGVDIFLTLSGFLITRNILRDIEERNFSLRKFYLRRLFRLYPSATTTALLAVVAAFLSFSTSLAYDTAASALASITFVSNVYFHAKDNYFSVASDLKPLLHTWSLSLEEQFYMLWPLVVTLIKSRSFHSQRGAYSTILFLSIVSLLIGFLFQKTHPSFVFFELPARIFQFSAGAILAFYKHSAVSDKTKETARPSLLMSVLAEAQHVLCLCLTLFLFTLEQKSISISVNVLVALATVIQIHSESTITSKAVLGFWIISDIGKLSYAAYLVHWPVYVFTNHFNLALQMGKPNASVLTILTVLLALLMKQMIEDPMRSSKLRRNHVALSVLFVLTLIISVTGIKTGGFGFRYNISSKFLEGRNAQQDQEVNIYSQRLKKTCNLDKCMKLLNASKGTPTCCVGDITGKRAPFSIFGDSFARHDAPALEVIGKKRKMWFAVYSYTGCAMKALAKPPNVKDANDCQQKRIQVQKIISKLPKYHSVVLSNHWNFMTKEGMTFNLRALKDEMSALGMKVYIVGEPPGLASQEIALFHTRDLSSLPLGKLLGIRNALEMTQKTSGCKMFGSKPCSPRKRTHKPIKNRIMQYRWYKEFFRNNMTGMYFIDRLAPLCTPRNATFNDINCETPVMSYDPPLDVGYSRDLFHLNWSGGKWFAKTFEQALFN